MACNVCVHTNDKKYTQTPDIPDSSFSSVNISSHKTIPDTNALNNRVWDYSEPVYWQLDTEYDILSRKQQEDLIKLSFLETSLLTPLRITQKRRQAGDAHIKISWLGAKDEKWFRDKPSTLGFAYGPQRGIGGDVTMNADYLWLLRKTPLTMKEAYDSGYITREKYDKDNPDNTLRYYDPVHTMKHEAGGHSCGMRHLTDINGKRTSVMYPYYNGTRVFSNSDQQYLFSLYGKSNIWQRISRFIQHKMDKF